MQALAFKAIRALRPDYPLWRDFPYEYEFDKLAIDVINGGTGLREWVDDPDAAPADLDALAAALSVVLVVATAAACGAMVRLLGSPANGMVR